jgi:Domain of unknown function (DUF4440)
MNFGACRFGPTILNVAVLLLGSAIMFGGSQSSSPRSADSSAEGAALDRQLTEAYLRQDWTALEKIVAPDYSGLTLEDQWGFPALKREFPKVHLVDLHVERQQIKRLSPDLILVSDVFTMHETYAGQDISGRYWSSDIWVRRSGKWLLLVEQEVPVK